MKRLAALFLLMTLFLLKIKAQSNLPPLYKISNDKDTVDQVTLPDDSWQMLRDPEGRWTIGQVSKLPLASQFHKNSGFDYSIKTYWIRYRLQNDLNHEVSITIGSNAAYYDLYMSGDSMPWQHYKSGNYVPWSQRDGEKRYGSIPISIKAGKEILVYKRVVYDFKAYKPLEFSTGFWFVNYSDTTEYLITVRNTFLFGIFLLTAIINFFFFWVARERVYLYYAMAMLFAGLLYFLDPLFIIFFREHPRAFTYSGQFLVTSLLFFLVHTFRHFLRTFDYYPHWDKFLILFGFIPILAFGSTLLWGVQPTLWNLLQGISYLTLFITCLFSVRKKDMDALLIIIASLPPLVLLGVLGLLNTLQPTLPQHVLQWLQKWIPGIELIVQFWSISIFSWILAHRYQKLQKQFMEKALEKERLAKEKEIEHSQLIARQKEELEVKVAERTSELKQSLEDLKTTQWQLIQSEKMASLGELTAGIAHEIQNPLYFVNNFSEVTLELGEEMKENLHAGDTSSVLSISDDILENLKKILHHGMRADGIVKNMLQHSRKSAGEKQLTDLNALAEEYLRLSYHGLRAKDKAFNAHMQVDLDESIEKINVVPQDISRVLLNLFNNAFYSVAEKVKRINILYQPTIWLSTKNHESTIEICIKDNGLGIPQKAIDKIFQPFFTTKPTGQGTGLGLSLSYDIITNEHGVEIKVKTKEGEYAEFIVLLPLKTDK